jgi:hypothetical protein
MRKHRTFTISRLKRKRGEIAGQILSVKGQLKMLQADLAAIDRSLGLLDPSIEPRKIRVLKPTHRFKYFEAGELAKLIFAELRKSAGQPVQVPPMVEAVMAAKGLDKSHRDAVREVSARVLAQLHQLAKRGRIQRIGRRVGVSWVMPPQ